MNRLQYFLLLLLLVSGCAGRQVPPESPTVAPVSLNEPALVERPRLDDITLESIRRILENAKLQLKTTTKYSQEYFNLDYPAGDPPADTGACTDVIIRSFRAAGVDLQKEVHEDMAANFGKYPRRWGLTTTDKNIDHRRVPNLQTYFSRVGRSLPLSSDPENFRPGDVVSWDLNGHGLTHIGLISNIWNEKTGRYLIIHNIGGGTRAEDRLFDWQITGHYRFFD